MLARTLLRSSLLPAFFLAATSALVAQDASAPMRAARLSSSQGTVTVTDGNNPAVPAQMNLPLVAGVQVATGQDGQAEIEFEDGSVARLTPNSALSLDRMDIAPGQTFVTGISLLRGLAYFELRATPDYVYSVNAGGDVVSPIQNTTVRVDFDQAPASFSVLDGIAEVQRVNSFQADLQASETLRADTSDSSRYFLTQQVTPDSWDQWNADMDQQAAQQASDSTGVRDDYAGAQGYGWGDLDNDGTWYDVPGQGPVWQPYAAEDDSDFDPYGAGAWVWYPATGYIWASSYPWGWTPYRCGAWSFYSSFGWGWAPGASCGGFGWGFAGQGYGVNIGRGPRGYRPIRVPVAKPGPVRPVIPVRTTADTGRKPDHVMPPGQRRSRQIAGVTAQPIAPIHSSAIAGETTQGESLRRDFPIDRSTHTPAMGMGSARPANVYHVGAAAQGQARQSFQGTEAGGFEPGKAARNPQAPQTIQSQHLPAQQGPPLRYTPQPSQQRQFSIPSAQPQHTTPEHPAYASPAQQQQRQTFATPAHPAYIPPPSQPHPSYSPAPAPHFSPPPSPPPAPHVSAPPPSAPAHR